MYSDDYSAAPKGLPVDLSIAGFALIFAAGWELIFSRLASALGIYSEVGASGLLAMCAVTGELALYLLAALALCLAALGLLSFSLTPSKGPMLLRVLVMMVSPLVLPVVAVAIFRPVRPELVGVGYFVAVAISLALAVLTVVRARRLGLRVLLLGLALLQLLAALERGLRPWAMSHSGTRLVLLPRFAYIFAEFLFVVLPVVAFFALRPGGALRDWLRRPPVAGLVFALLVGGAGLAAVLFVGEAQVLALVSFRALGVTTVLPGGAYFDLVGLFFGALTVGVLALSPRAHLEPDRSRQVAFGLLAIWIAGVQPTEPYLYALLLAGFLYLAAGAPEVFRPKGEGREAALTPVPCDTASIPFPDELPHSREGQ